MKNVLIISYYWPPNTGSGVQRWLKFSKYLPLFNWRPIIVTPDNPYIELKDNKLESEISNKVTVIKFPIWEPYSIKDKIFGKQKKSQTSGLISKDNSFTNRLLNWIRGNFFIPDPKKYWIKPTVKSIKEILNKQKVDVIISSGPPHSMHLIALELKKVYNDLKWIADFRDPWTKLDILEDFNLNNRSRTLHQKLELKVLTNADLVLTVGERWAKDFIDLGAKNVKVITNGYDHDDFKNYKPTKTHKFIVGHYGIMNHLRNPSNFWFALNKLCSENNDFDDKLEIRLSGNIDNKIIDEIKSHSFLKNKLVLLGFLNHKDVINEYANANLLLLLLFNSKSGEGNYPGKIFEYFASKKPILCFGPKESDVKNLLENNYGIYHAYQQQSNVIKNDILSLFNQEFEFNDIEMDKYSRKYLTKNLVNILENL
tara:strand:- start:140 stop:1417 length:1278 start_codon:yes stop_codon:yes gene_type:complete